MQRRKGIPSKPRFALATKRAYELLAELDICEFPVEPLKIIKHFPNWHLQGWRELHVNTVEKDPLNIDKEKAEAKTVKLRGSDEYLIVYDERVDNRQRIRWTLAHEIGHIVMGHLVHFDATALNRRGLTQEEYGVLEVEAHCFASDLLAPKTIIRRFGFRNDPKSIALTCDISIDAAERRLKEIKRMDFSYYPTENRILRNFYNCLESCGLYSRPTKRLSANSIRIPGSLDDYIECNYWPFIVMTVGYWEKEKELYAALEDSIALYDYEDMVIFVRGNKEADFARQGKNVILQCLKKYGESPVKHITLMVAEPAV